MWARPTAPHGPPYPPGAMPRYPYPYPHPGAPQGMYRGFPPGAMALGPDGKPIAPPTTPRSDTPSSQRSTGSKQEDEAEKRSDKTTASGEGQKEEEGESAPDGQETEGSKEGVDQKDKEGEVSSSAQADLPSASPSGTALSPSQEAGRTARPSTSQSPHSSAEALAAAREAYMQQMKAHAAQSHGMPPHPGYPYPPQPYNPAQMGATPNMPHPYSPQHPSHAHYGQRPWGYYPPGHTPPGAPQMPPEQEAYIRWKQQQYYQHQRRMQMAAAQQAAMATASPQQQPDAPHSAAGSEGQRPIEADQSVNPAEVTHEADEIPDYQESLVKLAMGIASSKDEKKDNSLSKDEGKEEEDGVKTRKEAPSSNSDETVSSSDTKGEAEPSSSSSGAKKQKTAITTIHHGGHPHRNPHRYPYPYHPGGYPHPAYHHPEAQWGQWPHPHADRRGYPMHPGHGYPQPPPHMQQGMMPPMGATPHVPHHQPGQLSPEEQDRLRYFQRTMTDHLGAMQGPGAFAGPPPHMYPQHPSQLHPSHQHASHPHPPPNQAPSLPSAVMGKQQGEARHANHHQEARERRSPKAANVNGEVPSEEDSISSTSTHGKLNALNVHSNSEQQAPPTVEEGEEEKEAEEMETES